MTDNVAESLAVMLEQERTRYLTTDYIGQLEGQPRGETKESGAPPNTIPDQPTLDPTSCVGVKEVWREKICEWSYQVIDHFNFKRETVAVSLSFLDRFLSTHRVNKHIFQLAAMTSLYLAIKLNDSARFKIQTLAQLGRGLFHASHFAAMEVTILRYVWCMLPHQ